jgi:hypothetical protein
MVLAEMLKLGGFIVTSVRGSVKRRLEQKAEEQTLLEPLPGNL